MRYPMTTGEQIDFVCLCDPAVALPELPKKGKTKKEVEEYKKAEKSLDSLIESYKENPDLNLLDYHEKQQPLVWKLQALGPAAHAYASEKSESMVMFQYRLAALGIKGLDNRPDGVPPLTFQKNGVVEMVSDDWIAMMPLEWIAEIALAVLKLSGRDEETEKNWFTRSGKSK